MYIAIFSLLIDFGLVILIWMIQLIVYPSFLYYETGNLIAWHKKYVLLIGFIVAPLMLLQLGILVYQIFTSVTIYHSVSLVIILSIWVLTFLEFVPIHSNISKGNVNEKMLLSLVKKNWSRTILWSLLFVCCLLSFFYRVS